MNRNRTRVPTEFGPETRFEVRPHPPTPFRAAQESEFERLKTELLAEQLNDATPELVIPVRRAANEAAAIAWNTAVPLLVFPTLFEEKTAVAVRQAARQARIYENSRELVAA
ncbi:MAG TPA: hypothetical protein VHG89_13720 [Verrucomicrobiae bacterium]|nr:hypothetical protein [Verrucomicrobiae bacterium]